MVIVAGPIGYSWWWEDLDGLILMPVKVIVYHMQLGVKEWGEMMVATMMREIKATMMGKGQGGEMPLEPQLPPPPVGQSSISPKH